MDWPLVVAWIALGCNLLTACGVIWLLTRWNSDGDVGELARHVAALRKANRAEQMRRVREEAVENRAASAPLDKDGKPFPFGPLPTMDSLAEKKAALRRQVFGPRASRGNGES